MSDSANNKSFKQGDVVELKSGGPDMTVEDAYDHEQKKLVKCVWFEGGKVVHHTFEAHTLKENELRKI